MMKPKTLQEAMVHFSDEDNCLEFMKFHLWPDGVVTCPTCKRKDVTFLAKQRKWQCKSVHAKRQFSAKVGTIFVDSPFGLDKWLPAVWLITNSKNGVSSCEIARSLGVTQKTAWFMLHRIRFAILHVGDFMQAFAKIAAAFEDGYLVSAHAEGLGCDEPGDACSDHTHTFLLDHGRPPGSTW